MAVSKPRLLLAGLTAGLVVLGGIYFMGFGTDRKIEGNWMVKSEIDGVEFYRPVTIRDGEIIDDTSGRVVQTYVIKANWILINGDSDFTCSATFRDDGSMTWYQRDSGPSGYAMGTWYSPDSVKQRTDKQAQKLTIAMLESIGENFNRIGNFEKLEELVPKSADLSYEEVDQVFRPRKGTIHMGWVPRYDGWGHALEFKVRTKGGKPYLIVRSPGRDGSVESPRKKGVFRGDDYDRDLIWARDKLVARPGA